MTAIIVPANGLLWRFAPAFQLPPPDPTRPQVMARATIVDDVSLSPPADLSATATGAFAACAGRDGLVGLVGRPSWPVPPADLAGLGVSLTVSAPGYRDTVLSGPLPPQPDLPVTFAPLDLGVHRLVREPVFVRGRVLLRQGGVFEPLAGADVRVVGASPVPLLAGALPAPVAVAGLIGTSALTNGDGEYRFGPFARFATLRLQVVAPMAGPTVELGPSLGETALAQDFRIG